MFFFLRVSSLLFEVDLTGGFLAYCGLVPFHFSADAHRYDVVIVGGGIVGNATAMELSIRHPQLKLAVLEKEPVVGEHTVVT